MDDTAPALPELRAWSPKQVAAALNLPERQVYNAISRGDLEAVRVGKHYRITDSALRTFLLPKVAA